MRSLDSTLTAETRGVFEASWNTGCFRNELKHKVFSKRSQTQGAFQTSENTRCFRNDLKHKVFSKRAETRGAFETSWNTRCFRNDRKHKVFSKKPETQGVFETIAHTRCSRNDLKHKAFFETLPFDPWSHHFIFDSRSFCNKTFLSFCARAGLGGFLIWKVDSTRLYVSWTKSGVADSWVIRSFGGTPVIAREYVTTLRRYARKNKWVSN